jgi:non-specific serine/threonine protein kinase
VSGAGAAAVPGGEAAAPFGALLKRHRLAAGLTHEALAERANVSARAISDLERGLSRAPRRETVALLADALRLAPGPRAALEAAARRPAAPGAGPGRPHNLPVQLTRFVGREREVAAVEELLGRARLVTVTGTGGAGKTRLAVRVAAELLDADGAPYPDGAWFVDLAPLADERLVPQAALAALGLKGVPGRPPLELLTEHLRPRTALLVPDNCEHLLDGCARLADAVLRACPRVRILATSRELLGLPGEVAWRVPSLTLPPPEGGPAPGDGGAAAAWVSAVAESEAVRLFVDRVRLVRPDFAVTAANAAALGHVCRRLDGIPLAIELAAARARTLPVDQLARRLDDRFRLLTGGSRTALPRQQTLRATLDWSHGLLDASEQALLRRLAVFAGGWTVEAAERVCAGGGLAAGDVLELLGRLVDKSLVLLEAAGGEGRYRLLETIRQYAGERLLEAGEAEATRGRHLGWCVDLGAQAEPHVLGGAEQLAWLARLEAEHDNLRAALAWSLDGDPAAGLRLAGSLAHFWRVRSFLTEGQRWMESLLAAAPRGTAERVKALAAAGGIAAHPRDWATTRARLEEAVALGRALGEQRYTAWALRDLGGVAAARGDRAQARALLHEALALVQAAGDERGRSATLLWLGRLAAAEGDYPQARAALEEGLTRARRVDERWLTSDLLRELGGVLLDEGQPGRAEALVAEALALAQEVHSPQHALLAQLELGRLAWWRGDLDRATERYGAGLAAARARDDRWETGAALAGLGRVAAARGDPARATALLDQSRALWVELGEQRGLGSVLCGLGRVAGRRGDAERALVWLRESLRRRQRLGDRSGIAESLEGWAAVVAPGQPARATRLLGAAAALRAATGAPLPPIERPGHETTMQLVRAALGEAAFGAAWADGQGMPMERAVAYALQDPPAAA